MALTALLLKPWCNLMRHLHLIPRVLADDVMVLARGADHVRRFQIGFTQTHGYVQDIGGRIAPSKSYTFSTHPTARQWLRDHIWQRLDAIIQVVLHARDLGAHLNLSQ